MTNFVLTGARGADDRYRTAKAALERSRGRADAGVDARRCCATSRQPITRWSVAYDLRARVAHVVMGQKYGGRALTFAMS